MKKYEKYDELHDSTLKLCIENHFKPSWKRGWYISEIVRLKDKWLIKWERKTP